MFEDFGGLCCFAMPVFVQVNCFFLIMMFIHFILYMCNVIVLTLKSDMMWRTVVASVKNQKRCGDHIENGFAI